MVRQFGEQYKKIPEEATLLGGPWLTVIWQNKLCCSSKCAGVTWPASLTSSKLVVSSAHPRDFCLGKKCIRTIAATRFCPGSCAISTHALLWNVAWTCVVNVLQAFVLEGCFWQRMSPLLRVSFSSPYGLRASRRGPVLIQ
jgi:hypothetical protein